MCVVAEFVYLVFNQMIKSQAARFMRHVRSLLSAQPAISPAIAIPRHLVDPAQHDARTWRLFFKNKFRFAQKDSFILGACGSVFNSSGPSQKVIARRIQLAGFVRNPVDGDMSFWLIERYRTDKSIPGFSGASDLRWIDQGSYLCIPIE